MIVVRTVYMESRSSPSPCLGEAHRTRAAHDVLDPAAPRAAADASKEGELADINVSMGTERGGHRAQLTIGGTRVIETPPVEHLVYYAGLGILVAAEIMELPVAVAIGVGHFLIGLTHRPGLESLGEVLGEV